MLLKSIMAIAPKLIQYTPPKNTLKNPVFDTTKWFGMEKAEKFFDNMDKFAEAIGKVGNVLEHPILIFNALNGASYWICIVIGLGGIILYICGHKGALKYTGGSLLGFVTVKLINAGLMAL